MCFIRHFSKDGVFSPKSYDFDYSGSNWSISNVNAELRAVLYTIDGQSLGDYILAPGDVLNNQQMPNLSSGIYVLQVIGAESKKVEVHKVVRTF